MKNDEVILKLTEVINFALTCIEDLNKRLTDLETGLKIQLLAESFAREKQS